jgi:hypothetical protein
MRSPPVTTSAASSKGSTIMTPGPSIYLTHRKITIWITTESHPRQLGGPQPVQLSFRGPQPATADRLRNWERGPSRSRQRRSLSQREAF